MQRPKVCMFVGYYPINRGGAEYQAMLLAQELSKLADVFYISPGQASDEVIQENGYRIYCVRTPLKGRGLFLAKNKILRILSDEQPDLIYQRVASASTGIATDYAKLSNCPVVWHISSEFDLDPPSLTLRSLLNLGYFNQQYRRRGILHATYIVAQARYQCVLLKQNFGREQFAVVSNFTLPPSSELTKPNQIRIMWVGNIKPLKQPNVFLELADKLSSYKHVQFVLAGRMGDPNLQSKVLEHCASSNNTTYLGELNRADLDQLMCSSHLLVNTSTHEGFPNTFIESWIRRVPVVSLNVDPDRTLVTHGIGRCSGSKEQLYHDVTELIENETLRIQMADAAQTYANGNHSIEIARSYANQLYEIATTESTNGINALDN